MRFRLTLDQLEKKENKTKEEERFISCYYDRMPLGCIFRRICASVPKERSAIPL